jgi:hypothetical protein
MAGADEGAAAPPLSSRDILVRAVAKMGAGIGLCALFSDPLVEALTHLSRCARAGRARVCVVCVCVW